MREYINLIKVEDAHDSNIKQRYSFTLPPDLIDRVDKLKDDLELNRSQVVREALNHWFNHRMKSQEFSGSGLAIFSFIYDLHDTNVISQVTKVRHDYEEEVMGSMNFHLEHHKRFEINICKGEFSNLKKISGSLRKIKEIQALTESYFQ